MGCPVKKVLIECEYCQASSPSSYSVTCILLYRVVGRNCSSSGSAGVETELKPAPKWIRHFLTEPQCRNHASHQRSSITWTDSCTTNRKRSRNVALSLNCGSREPECTSPPKSTSIPRPGSWKHPKTFPDPQTSPGCCTRTLTVISPHAVRDAEAGGGSPGVFSCRTILSKVGVNGVSIFPYHKFSSIVEPVRVDYASFRPRGFSASSHSLPSVI